MDDSTSQITDALRESEQKFYNAFEYASIGMALVSIQGKYLKCNQAFGFVTGYSQAELKNLSIPQITHPDDIGKDLENIPRMLAGEITTYDAEKRYFHKKGHIVWVRICASLVRNQKGEPLYFISQFEDISKRKQFEADLKDQVEFNKNLIQSLQDGVVIIDPNILILDVNPAMCLMTGFTREELVGCKPPFPHWPPEEYENIKAAFHETLNSRFTDHEMLFMRKSGERFPVILSPSAIKNRDNVVINYISTIKDITQLKLAELEKSKMQEQLFHASKLASIGTLAAGVAHEINNPLTIITNFAEIMAEKSQKKNKTDDLQLLHQIQMAAFRIETIVNGLRTYSRPDNDGLEDVNIHTCINETLCLVQSIYQNEKINIETCLRAHDFSLKANKGKLQQVIMNIVGNAKDALSESTGSLIAIATKDTRDGILIEIADNGPGIPPQLVEKIFDPFFTTKGPGKGTGLGLSISQTIINSFGGTIKVESVLGKGTKFKIILPRKLHKEKILEENKQVKEELKISGKVLVVDDEKNIRDILAIYLMSFGLEVMEAQNGEEAYQMIQTGNYDYVITDLKMPKMSGDELLHKIKLGHPNLKTKYLVMTGGILAEDQADEGYSLKSYADGYFHKPFRKSDVLNSLQSLI